MKADKAQFLKEHGEAGFSYEARKAVNHFPKVDDTLSLTFAHSFEKSVLNKIAKAISQGHDCILSAISENQIEVYPQPGLGEAKLGPFNIPDLWPLKSALIQALREGNDVLLENNGTDLVGYIGVPTEYSEDADSMVRGIRDRVTTFGLRKPKDSELARQSYEHTGGMFGYEALIKGNNFAEFKRMDANDVLAALEKYPTGKTIANELREKGAGAIVQLRSRKGGEKAEDSAMVFFSNTVLTSITSYTGDILSRFSAFGSDVIAAIETGEDVLISHDEGTGQLVFSIGTLKPYSVSDEFDLVEERDGFKRFLEATGKGSRFSFRPEVNTPAVDDFDKGPNAPGSRAKN